MVYTAILRRIFRDVATTDPKVLLTDVKDSNGNVYRGDGHCHMLKTHFVDVLPRESATVASYAIVTFEAEEISYPKRGEVNCTLGGKVKLLKVKYANKRKKVVNKTKKPSTKRVFDLFKQIERSKA